MLRHSSIIHFGRWVTLDEKDSETKYGAINRDAINRLKRENLLQA